MKPTRVAEVLAQVLRTRWPVFLWGPPGIGKSSVVRSVAAGLELPVTDIRASLLDPTDLRGIPSVAEGRAVWCPPSFLPHELHSKGLLFFDELNAAPPMVQASLYQLMLDRRIGEYVLPPGWQIVAAGNREGDGSVTFRMPTALANRFVHVEMEAEFEDWQAWAIRREVHPLVTGFLAFRPALLMAEKVPGEHAFATPRTWEMVSDVLGDLEDVAPLKDVLAGIVGSGVAAEFLAFAADSEVAQTVADAVRDPDRIVIPEKLSQLYALVSHLVARMGKAEIRRAAGMLLPRLPPEFGVMLVRAALIRQPGFLMDKPVQAFCRKHGKLLSGKS